MSHRLLWWSWQRKFKLSEELLTSLHHLGEEEATDKMLVVNEMSVVYEFYETTFWKYLKRQTSYCMRRTVTRMQKEVIACAKRMLQYSLCKAGLSPVLAMQAVWGRSQQCVCLCFPCFWWSGMWSWNGESGLYCLCPECKRMSWELDLFVFLKLWRGEYADFCSPCFSSQERAELCAATRKEYVLIKWPSSN